MIKVLNSELDYTGGGIYCISGRLENGNVFISSDDYTIVSVYDSEILDALERENENLKDSEFKMDLYDLDFHTCESYYIKDLTIEESYNVWLQVYNQHSDDLYIDTLTAALEDWYKRETEKAQ